jgi:hypothetical protein
MATSPPLGIGQPNYPGQPTWYQRNRRWFVPVLICAAILVIASFVGGVFSAVEYFVHSSYPYRLAVKTAGESPELAAIMGSPMHVGFLAAGSINSSGPEGNVSISVPISGPTGKGDIIVVAKKHANRWTFESFEVDVAGREQPIQLKLPQTVVDARPSEPNASP